MRKNIRVFSINRNNNLTEEDINRILILKNGLEDLNLIISEIERTYKILSDGNLSDEEISVNKQRLKSLEKLMANINATVNNAMNNQFDKSKFS